MIWSFDDHRAYRIGEAIVNLCLALGGWIDWGADGKVRLLSKRNGRVGMFFPVWLVEGMKDNRDFIKKYFDLIRAGENDNRDRVRAADDSVISSPRRRFCQTTLTQSQNGGTERNKLTNES